MSEEHKEIFWERWVPIYRQLINEAVGLAGEQFKIGSALEIGSQEGAMIKAVSEEFPGAEIVALDPRSAPLIEVPGLQFLQTKAENYIEDQKKEGKERRFDLITVATVDGLQLTAEDFSQILNDGGLVFEYGCTLNITDKNKDLTRIDNDRIRQVRVWRKNYHGKT